jgi:hypothetical protein
MDENDIRKNNTIPPHCAGAPRAIFIWNDNPIECNKIPSGAAHTISILIDIYVVDILA